MTYSTRGISARLWRMPETKFKFKDIDVQVFGLEWSPGYHGTGVEFIYSILYHMIILTGRDKSRGENTVKNAPPGVYLHKEQHEYKCDNYMRLILLFGDGTFCRVHMEVRMHCDALHCTITA